MRTTGELGPLLKRLRKAKKLSQTDLGRRIGLSQERISAIENHPGKVTMDNLFTVLMALDVHFNVVEQDPAAFGGAQKKEEW